LYGGLLSQNSKTRQAYFEHYHEVNPYFQRAVRYERAGFIGRSRLVCAPNEFDEMEFHQDFFRSLDLFHACRMTALSEGGFTANLDLARPKKMGIFTDEEEQLMRFLMPHLQRAFRITNLISDLSDENKFLAVALDKLPQGVIVVSRNGHILFLNSSAKRITDAHDGVSIDRQRTLRALNSNDTHLLLKLIATASQPSLDGELSHGGILQLDRPAGRRPLSLLIAPLSQDKADLNFRQPSALIFITDPELKMEPGESVMQRLYRLTPTEARLTMLLTQGKSLAEASAELRVTHNTTRTHLKRIFQKTGARRQSELVKLLLNSPATIK
jgi:DNA-binding CsgD family transcriptional regulator